jgi:hypothetical protein
MRTYRIAPAALALLTLSLLLPTAGGCFDGLVFPAPDDQRDRGQEPNDPNPDGDQNSDRAGDYDPDPDEPGSNQPLPTLRLSKEGGLDSVVWRGRELLRASASGKRKPLVQDATLLGVEGLTSRFRQRQSGNLITVQLAPAPGGFDVRVVTESQRDGEVFLWLGPQEVPGRAQALLPTWAGHLTGLTFPAAGGQVYDYPGKSFAPVLAFWGNRTTVGYAALAEIGDEVRLQLYQPSADAGAIMARVGFRNGCRAGERLQHTITVRYAEQAGDWESVLQPYQQHQLRRDGPVRYQRLGPWVSYNMRNSHDYDDARKDFTPGSTWENRLGKHWEWALREAAAGRLEVGCLGVWSQMEERDRLRLGFNPDVLDLEKSLGGSLPGLMTRLRREYGPIPISAFSRPTRKVVNNQTVTRDLDDPNDWRAALAQLQGLRRLGFDLAYGDEVGFYGGWRSVDLVEQAPVRVIVEWGWDRIMTRASCLMAHQKFPYAKAALLVPYLTPGGELYVKAVPERAPLFREGAVTPWQEYVSKERQQLWNQCARSAEANRPERRP